MSSPIGFYLNDQKISTREPAGLLVLDFLRRRAKLMGAKEGCKEGDCGACGVLIGELEGNSLKYKPVTSCLVPLGELAGKHLVTVEGLRMEHLSTIQKHIVGEGASQCGFCTPGIVVSLTGRLIEKGASLNIDDVKYALSGHLCRCTGYASLIRTGQLMIKDAVKLGKAGNQSTNIKKMVEAGMLPKYFLDIPAKLSLLQSEIDLLPIVKGKDFGEIFIAGGTDIYVQRGEMIPDMKVEILNRFPDMKGISVQDGEVHIGALTTFEEFGADQYIQSIIPEIGAYLHLIASLQIRNRATLGGNIVNASPIGDMTILLLALGSRLILKNDDRTRNVPMTEFFLGYKTLDKTPSEIVTEIIFPEPAANVKINYEKVSKRKCLDISTVTSAIRITHNRQIIEHIGLTLGGVAPIPLFMKKTCNFLKGQEIAVDTIKAALSIAQGEIAPISDIRGSAEYKQLLARQLIIAHFTRLFPEYVPVKEILSNFCS